MNDKVYDQREVLVEDKTSSSEFHLDKTVARARAELIEKFTPLEYAARTGRQVTIPLDNADAVELLRRFNAHYFAWTGKCLKEVR